MSKAGGFKFFGGPWVVFTPGQLVSIMIICILLLLLFSSLLLVLLMVMLTRWLGLSGSGCFLQAELRAKRGLAPPVDHRGQRHRHDDERGAVFSAPEVSAKEFLMIQSVRRGS